MLITGLDGRPYQWDLTGYAPTEDDTTPRSSHHMRARVLLRTLYPMDRLLEEIPLPGTDGLRLDFFLPNRLIAIEIQGIQHRKYVDFFHKDLAGYIQSKCRDERKKQWLTNNGIALCEWLDHEEECVWARKLLGI